MGLNIDFEHQKCKFKCSSILSNNASLIILILRVSNLFKIVKIFKLFKKKVSKKGFFKLNKKKYPLKRSKKLFLSLKNAFLSKKN